MRAIAVWVAIAAGLYLLLAWAARRSLFYPMKYPAGEWSEGRRIGARDVEIVAADGVKLHGWFVPTEGARWVTLHLHGNAGNVTHRSTTGEAIRAAGSSVLLLDYRGYGKSAGSPSESGLHADAAGAYEWLRAQGHQPSSIVLHGESIGTAIAATLAARRKCAGVVLEAPFPSARAVAARVLPVVGPLLISGLDTRERVRELKVPLLVIHGARDEVIDYDLGRQVFEAAREPKSMWTVEGAGHNDLYYVAGAELPGRLRAFYASLNR
jgi:fermentation-respiration switch protein FrsA (DUF1100 family)